MFHRIGMILKREPLDVLLNFFRIIKKDLLKKTPVMPDYFSGSHVVASGDVILQKLIMASSVVATLWCQPWRSKTDCRQLARWFFDRQVPLGRYLTVALLGPFWNHPGLLVLWAKQETQRGKHHNCFRFFLSSLHHLRVSLFFSASSLEGSSYVINACFFFILRLCKRAQSFNT